MAEASLVWYRNDLRLGDNPALQAAIDRGGPVHALYIEETDPSLRPIGAAARWWLHRSLRRLAGDLAEAGIRLETRRGPAADTLLAAAREHNAGAVFWNRRYGPASRDIDAAIKSRVGREGMETASFAANVLVEPFEIQTGEGKPYSVYAPFWKSLRSRDIPRPLPAPRSRERVPSPTEIDGTYDEPGWTRKLEQHWEIGERAARVRLDRFLDEAVANYPRDRDFPARQATSRLSPHLRFGEISPRQVWHAALAMAHRSPARAEAIDKFLSELGWRDFNIHQLFHRIDIATVSMQPKYADIRWRRAEDDLEAWQRGRTGIPIVDAGMRELWATGYMQNRVRMLTASLLTKNLLIDWREGEAWFWDTLVDADEANNPGNWQWVAGTGLDAAPYFRIFNPVTQGEKFDADGEYVRTWLPELAGVPDKWVHQPDRAPDGLPGRKGPPYPYPIVDLAASRKRAIEAYGTA